MNKEDIRDAITLFQYSKTAAMGRGPSVLATLQNLFKDDEVGFHAMRRKTLRGQYLKGRDGYDLQVNPEFLMHLAPRERLAALSLVLVHEATHATVDFRKLYDELAARLLPVAYYRELSGAGVYNEAADPPVPGKPSGIIRISQVSFPEFQAQSDALKKDQLIDYILDNDTYTDSDYIDEQWVFENLTNWGGIGNRWPSTKALYINQIDTSYDPRVAGVILTILESVKTHGEWTKVYDAIDSHRDLRHVLHQAKRNPQIAARIAALEAKWRVRLDEQARQH